MSLFKLNKDMAVKLNQSFETLYNLEYAEYSLLLNIVNAETEAKNEENDLFSKPEQTTPLRVNLPEHLRLK
jgi:hypothetical protein